MTSIFSGFSAPVATAMTVPSVKTQSVKSEKELKKEKIINTAKAIAPYAVAAIAIPVTAGITYKIASKNTAALKKEISNLTSKVDDLSATLADDIAKLKEAGIKTDSAIKTIKAQTTKNTKDNAQIWSAILAIGGLSGTYKAGKLSQADKDEITSKVSQRVNNIDSRSSHAVDTANRAMSTKKSALSSKYTADFNGISLLTNNDTMSRNSVKYEAALKQIQGAAQKYLFSAPQIKPITSESPALWSVTSEFAPIKEGGLGSVPVEIQNNVTKLGVQIPTFIPMYQRKGTAALKQENGIYTYNYKGNEFKLEKAASFKVDSYQGGKPKSENVEIFVSNKDGKQLIFVKNDSYFDGTIYQTTDKTEEPEKFAFFSKAVYEFAKAKTDEKSVKGLNIEDRKVFDSIPSPDAFVLNDWQASPIAALARYKAPMENAHGQLSDDASKKLSNINIITIGHNAMYQGSTRNNNDNAQRTEATTNILNTLFDNYAYDIVSNATSNAVKSNPSDKGLENLDNVLILNKQDSNANHTNLLNMGICLSNYFHPVSENYAKELISSEHSDLAGELQWALTQKSKAGSVVGIINGNDFNNLSIEAKHNTIKNQTGLNFATYNKQSDISKIMSARLENKKKFYNEFMIPFTESKGSGNLVSEGTTNLPKLSDEELAQTPVIASVGRLVSQKGIGIMSDAIKMLLDNWETNFPGKNKPIFYIAGSDGEGGVHANNLKDLKANRLSQEDSNRVVFANGYAPMPAITGASDFFLLPSIFEPCGLTQGEAFALATPVIGSAVGGIVDTVNRDGKTNGILTSKDEKLTAENFYEAMKKGLEVYFNNPEQYQKMVKDSLAEDFSWIQKGKQGPVYDYLDKVGIDRTNLPDVE